ncbi:TPA: glucosaminidase domain-containing protein, partial [Streptococcus agalactiae]
MLTIHGPDLKPVLFLDNDKQGALNYFNHKWYRKQKTGSSVLEFSVYKKDLLGDSPLSHKYHVLNDQAFVSFVHKGKVQLLNIMKIDEDEKQIDCYCENLNLELLNEYCNAYKATKAMSFEEYLVQFDILSWGALTVGTNEVKDKKLTLEWTSQETKLARLLSIANNFDAEIEFETKLNFNHTFKQLIINIYKEYEEGKSYGVGRDKTDVILRYQKNISGIRKTVDKRQIYNAIRPYGKKTVKGERVISNPVTRKVTKTVGSNRTYLGGDLKYYGHTIKKANVQAIINYAVQYNILPSGIITQLYLESYWGDSAVGRRDNNWAGMTGGAQTRPSGVKVTTGMARPANEGGTYMHYASVDDFLKDYTYLLAKQGIYNVVGKKNIADYTKGLFKVGGAKYDYAAAGYQSYTNLMTNIRNGINKASGNILNTIDTLWQTPVKPITSATTAKRATKTIQAINEATKLKGRRIGSGQCYALSGWYAKKLDGAWIDSSIGGIRGRIGDGMAAALIGTDYNWGAYGWKVDKSPNAGNLKAGGIYNVRANRGAPFYTTGWGHTGIIKSVSKTRVTVLEQNFAGRMYVVENSYEINAFARGLQTVCYPREIAQGMAVNGATTQQVSGGTQISYEEVVQEAQTESYEEEQIIYIDNSIYKEWKDENGKVEYYLKNGFLYAPLSRDRYPSVLTGNETRDNWIRKDMEVETDSQDVLISTALKDLKAHAYPAITYEVDGYVDLELGDVVRIQDDGYEPPLILTARVTEQEISSTNPNSNKTKFSNFVEKESQLATDLISDMLRLYDESIPYEITLATSNGVAFKNGTGESVLTPSLQKNGKDYEAVYFYKNGDSLIDIGPSLIVKASDFNHVLNITVEAYLNEELVASTQISFTDTEDGEKGDDGKSSWTAWANSEDGKVDFSITESKNRRFIGTYTGIEQSTNYLDYKWTDMSANVAVGTQNLLDGTKSFSGSWFTEGAKLETIKISEYPFEFKKWKSGNKISHTIEFDVKAGVTYTFTAAIARENAGRLYFYLYDLFANHITSNTPRETIIENVTRDIQMFKVTFVPLRDGKIKPRFAMLASDAGWFMTGGYMLVKGNKSGDWQESEADKASNLDSKADQELTRAQILALEERTAIARENAIAEAMQHTLSEVETKWKLWYDLNTIDEKQKVAND